MVILGIDPGTATTGYALLTENSEGEAQLLGSGVLVTSASTAMPRRLLAIHQGVVALIAHWAPAELAIEELFFSRNVSTALTVGQARGVVLLAAAQADLEIFEYKPAVVKQALVGYGSAGKKQMQEMVRLMLGLETAPSPDDAADAVAVAICHLHSARIRKLANV